MSIVIGKVDFENNALEFWNHVVSAADTPDEIRNMPPGGEITLSRERAKEIRAWCNAAPGFKNGPVFAREAILFHTERED